MTVISKMKKDIKNAKYMRLCSFYLFLRSSHRPERCVRKDHVVSVQGSGLVGLLLKVLSGTD